MIRGTRESEPPAVGAIVLAVLLTAGVLAGCGPAEVAEGPPPVRPIKMVEIGDALSTVNREYPGRIAAQILVLHKKGILGTSPRIRDLPETQLVSNNQIDKSQLFDPKTF